MKFISGQQDLVSKGWFIRNRDRGTFPTGSTTPLSLTPPRSIHSPHLVVLMVCVNGT